MICTNCKREIELDSAGDVCPNCGSLDRTVHVKEKIRISESEIGIAEKYIMFYKENKIISFISVSIIILSLFSVVIFKNYIGYLLAFVFSVIALLIPPNIREIHKFKERIIKFK